MLRRERNTVNTRLYCEKTFMSGADIVEIMIFFVTHIMR